MPILVLSAFYALDLAHTHRTRPCPAQRVAARTIGEYLMQRGYEEAAKFWLGDAWKKEFRL